ADVGVDFAGDEFTSSTLAGLAGAFGRNDGVGAAARMEGPNGNALDGDFLYFVDRNFDNAGDGTLGMTVRRLTISTRQVDTLAGSATQAGTADGPGATARFARLRGIAF